MPAPTDITPNSSTEDIIANVGASLFGNAEAEDKSNPIDLGNGAETRQVTPPATEKPATSLPEGSTPQNTDPASLSQAQLRALPKSWKKEMEAHWAKMPPAVHDYVYEREANVMRGLQQYSDGYKRWDSLISPYKDLFSEQQNLDPVQLMQGLMNAHLGLIQAEPAARRNMALEMLKHYGVDLSPAEESAALAELRQQVASLQSATQKQQQEAYQARYNEALGAVEKFAKDPANKFYEEVAADIGNILKSGMTRDLKAAYEMACWNNPTVRQKMLAEQQQPAAADKGTPAAPKFPNLDASPVPKPRKTSGSIEDTINEVVRKHYQTS